MNEMLYIFDHDETELPEELHFSHNICVRLHDQLVKLLKDKAVQRKLNVKIDFKEGDKKPKDGEEDIIGWLIENGWQNVADEIVSKNLILALTSDICHFIYQSLNSAKNIKMSVAYTLIRKPFLENLLIIEQLLNDEKEFLKKFEGTADNFDPGKLNDVSKRKLIEDSIRKINTILLDKNQIYELRFDKKNENSFYAMTNLATHLVTTRHPTFKTENQNLNFIFSGFDEWEAQLEHYYYFVPYMLFYVTEVVDQYIFEKKMITKKNHMSRKFYRLICQMLHHDQFDKKSIKGNSLTNKLSKAFKVKCNSCNKLNHIYKSDLYLLVKNDHILCKHCLIDLYYENESMNNVIEKLFKNKASS